MLIKYKNNLYKKVSDGWRILTSGRCGGTAFYFQNEEIIAKLEVMLRGESLEK
jgi:hypothetical protein